jgi:threonine/homoserine/homoserine lactone efflux protein
MTNWAGFIPTALCASLMPGASALLGLRNAVRYGAARALLGVGGRLAGLAVIIGLVAGLGAALVASPEVLRVIQWGGVGYLSWLGISALRRMKTVPSYVDAPTVRLPTAWPPRPPAVWSAPTVVLYRPAEPETVRMPVWPGCNQFDHTVRLSVVSASPGRATKDVRSIVLTEFGVAVTNPKAWLLFAALLPQFSDGEAARFVLLGVAYLAVELVVAAGYVVIGGRIGSGGFKSRTQRRIDVFSGACFVILATLLAVDDLAI